MADETVLSKIASEAIKDGQSVRESIERFREASKRAGEEADAAQQRLHRLELALAALIRKGVIDEKEIAV